MDLIVLIIVCVFNGRLALRKGLSPGTWRMYTVLAWIGFETIGVVIGAALFGIDHLLEVASLGAFCGLGGYLLIRYLLEQKPDKTDEEDINRIGVNDLQPPKRNA